MHVLAESFVIIEFQIMRAHFGDYTDLLCKRGLSSPMTGLMVLRISTLRKSNRVGLSFTIETNEKVLYDDKIGNK